MYYHLLDQARAKEERAWNEIEQDRLIAEARKARARHVITLLSRLHSFILGKGVLKRIQSYPRIRLRSP